MQYLLKNVWITLLIIDGKGYLATIIQIILLAQVKNSLARDNPTSIDLSMKIRRGNL